MRGQVNARGACLCGLALEWLDVLAVYPAPGDDLVRVASEVSAYSSNSWLFLHVPAH